MKLPDNLMGLLRTVVQTGRTEDSAFVEGLAEHVDLLSLLATACEAAGDEQSARDAARCWALAVPLDAYAHYKLGVIEQRLGNYPEAALRFQVAAELAGPEGDVLSAAIEALQALDQMQLQQIMALVEGDMEFRVLCLRDPISTLRGKGFAVSASAARHVMDCCQHPYLLDGASLPPTRMA